MYSLCLESRLIDLSKAAIVVACGLSAPGCQREQRLFQTSAEQAAPAVSQQMSEL
jgi:hypothetical protein